MFSLPTITMVSSVLAVVLWATGFVMGYMAYTRSMADLLAQNVAFALRLSNVENAAIELRGDMKYTRQDIAEIKLYILPKK